jgi:predicted phosphodiesterase
MTRVVLSVGIAAILAAAVLFSRGTPLASKPSDNANPFGVSVAEKNPWTNLSPNANTDQFQFVVVSDRTGGHRDKIFSKAVSQINLMQPEFVVSVGDLIEGYSTDVEKVKPQWDEFDSYVKKLEMPFFYVPGNHDITNREQVALWAGRYGKAYYSFQYKGVLFLCLNSEDGQGGNIMGPEQIDFVKKTLEETKGAKWTMIFMHKPIWTAKDQEKAGWAEIERALMGRNYTVFCGHVHRYQKFVRNGMNYYQLATTGGGSKLRGIPYGEFDQIAWITMKPEGPRIANILLDGLLPENLQVPDTDEKGVERKMLATVPIAGKLTMNGKPLENYQILFTMLKPPAGIRNLYADGISEKDGTFTLSTYTKFDGAPVGEYAVTVVPNLRRPGGLVVAEKDVPKLPAKYAKAETTPLKVTIKESGNQINLEITE